MSAPWVQPVSVVTESPVLPFTRRVSVSLIAVTSAAVSCSVLLPEPVRSMISMPEMSKSGIAGRSTVTPEPSTRRVSVPDPPKVPKSPEGSNTSTSSPAPPSMKSRPVPPSSVSLPPSPLRKSTPAPPNS